MKGPQDPVQRALLEQYFQSKMQRRLMGSIDRRTFLKQSAAAAAAGAMIAPFTNFKPEAVAAAKKVLQDGGNSADAAVAAAQQYSGITLNVVWEEALQLEDPLNFSGPMWEELTGIKINPIGKPFPELFPSQVAEHIGQTGAYDVLSIVPAWFGDFVAQGVCEPLDPFIEQYMNPADLEDYHPLYKDLLRYGGQIYGLFDDGDVIILYYRKDLFEDQANKDEYLAATGKELAVPTTWEDFDQIAAFFTEKGGGNYWGAASQRVVQTYGWFTEEFRNRGGRFFNEETMDATLDSEAGVTTLTAMVERNKHFPPGVETWGFVEVLSAWMAGQLAMIGGTWPPIGRWSEGTTAEQLNWVPETQVAGKVGYSVMPMGHSLHNAGFSLGVSADSENKEAAYLFIQWMTSPTISLQRVMLPYALRDPYRLSHFSSEEYRARWATAGEYLDTLEAAADGALLDLIMPGANEYNVVMDQMVTSAQSGTPVADALATANAAFNEITDRIGRDVQKAAYQDFLALKGSYYDDSGTATPEA
ncbi:MAG: extracellular solute-binding protein [Chloroflexota bacterium]|nr:extracellular solute-binding protein [Chloroflexota bacterium]